MHDYIHLFGEDRECGHKVLVLLTFKTTIFLRVLTFNIYVDWPQMSCCFTTYFRGDVKPPLVPEGLVQLYSLCLFQALVIILPTIVVVNPKG